VAVGRALPTVAGGGRDLTGGQLHGSSGSSNMRSPEAYTSMRMALR
jgi:hypothetical protein